ncbi:MAG: VWA domain-containing protein [Actinomycetota bacterium]|nr:VWA domain-containing protein [Actinomycetota bacterium]
MIARRATAVALLAALLAGALATGVAAQVQTVRVYCAAVTVRGAWEHVALPSFAAGPQETLQFAVDPADPSRLYATNGVAVAVSSDGGCSWRTTFRLDAPPDGADYSADDSAIVDLVAAPGHALLAISQRGGGRPHVVLSSYSGDTWRRGDDGLRAVLGRPLAVAMTRANPGYAYLLVEERAGSGEAGVSLRQTVFESTTAGGAWGVRGDPGPPDPGVDVPVLGSVLGRTNLAEIVPDPVEAGRLFLFGPDGLFHHQQGRRDRLLNEDVSAVLVGRVPGAAQPVVVAAGRGTRRIEVSRDGGASFSAFAVPGDVDSFAEALRPGDFYFSSGGRVFLRSGGRSTEVPGGGGVTNLTFARSRRQTSPFVAEDVLTLYGRTGDALVRREETRAVQLAPVPDSVTVGNLAPFGPIDPEQALPGTLTPERKEVVLLEGRSKTIPYELFLPETPTPLDVFFDVDTTRSMVPAIDGLRASIANIILELTAARIDVHFGVGQYRSFETRPAFERLQDINPPGPALAAALNRLMADNGGFETQLESLRQIATGAGSGTGVGIAPGQDAHWRKGSLRIVVNMTDEPISEGPQHPTYEEVARVMLADDTVHFGIAVQNEATAQALGPPLPGLIRIARETDSLAPAEGVDCDGDGDPDLYENEPLVCVIDHATSRDAGVLGGAIISVLRSLRDVGEVGISATVTSSADGPVATAVPDEPVVAGVDFKSNNTIEFAVELMCPSLDATRRFPIDVEASREAGVLAAATATLTCKAKPEPEPEPPLPPVIPPAVVVALVPPPPPPPPPPPVNPGPHPNPNPNPQPQPQMQPQPQSQPQGALASQRQTQPQLAVVQQRTADFAPAEARRGASEEYALSSYAPPRAGPNGAMLGLAAALVIAFGTAMLAAQRVELRLARQRSFRYANDLRRRR